MPFDEFIQNRSVQVILTLLAAAVLNVAGRLVIDHLIRRLVRSDNYENQADARKREDTIINVFNTTFSLFLGIVTICVTLAIMHVNIAALITGAGVFGVIFGFGAQSTIKSYLAGIHILSENQYRVGDVITLSGGNLGPHAISGVVEEISLRVTKLRHEDGTLNIIANGDAGTIANKTYKFGNILINLDVSYDSDLDLAEKVINHTGERMMADDRWKTVIVEPIHFLRVEDFTQGGVLLKVVGKVTPGDQWEVAGEFRRRLKKAFDKREIEFAVPESVVHNETSEQEEEEAEADEAKDDGASSD